MPKGLPAAFCGPVKLAGFSGYTDVSPSTPVLVCTTESGAGTFGLPDKPTRYLASVWVLSATGPPR